MNTQDNTYIFFLGNHPALSAAECWRVLVSQGFKPQLNIVDNHFLILTTSQPLPPKLIDSLGGTDRIGHVLASQETTWQPDQVLDLLSSTLPQETKVVIGISTLNLPLSFNKKIGIALKKAAKKQGIRIRFITPKSSSRLNAAQLIFNQLTDSPNLELTFLQHQDTHYLIQTEQIQNITAYEPRDTDRPARDARIGLLPPKLAQIMINISLAETPSSASAQTHIFDPFCGMGTVLQEAWLMNHQSTGADSNPKMIIASRQNLAHLSGTFSVDSSTKPHLFQHDTTIPYPQELQQTFTNIVTEPFLGAPLSKPLPRQALPAHFSKLGQLYHTSLTNLSPLLKPASSLLFILPAFRSPARTSTFIPFPKSIVDAFSQLGYSKVQLIPDELQKHFQADDRNSCIYARPDALVGRELTLWTNK